MFKSAAITALFAVATFGYSAPLLDDGFDLGFPDIVKPGAADYTPEYVDLGQDFMGIRGASAANFVGTGNETFTIAGGNGQLSATATGNASGLMELSYHGRAGADDFSNVASVTIYVTSNSAALTGGFGVYSNGYTQLSGGTFSLPAGFTGAKTFTVADLGGQPLDVAHVDSMFCDFDVAPGASIVLDRVTVNPVPEPASLAAMALGLGVLARRKRTIK